MDTLLVATQVICYGVGVLSASLNIATFVHRRVKRRRKTLMRSKMLSSLSTDLPAYRLATPDER